MEFLWSGFGFPSPIKSHPLCCCDIAAIKTVRDSSARLYQTHRSKGNRGAPRGFFHREVSHHCSPPPSVRPPARPPSCRGAPAWGRAGRRTDGRTDVGRGLGAALPQDGDLQINVKAARGKGSSPAKGGKKKKKRENLGLCSLCIPGATRVIIALTGLRCTKSRSECRGRGETLGLLRGVKASGLLVRKCAKVSVLYIYPAWRAARSVRWPEWYPAMWGGPCPHRWAPRNRAEGRGKDAKSWWLECEII